MSWERINFENKVERARPSWDEYFLNIAKTVASRSHDAETQVGAVVVSSQKRIIATGYNGFPANCEDERFPNLRPDKYPFMIHAEINAIVSSKQDLSGATIYCTHSPCHECAKLIVAAGIKLCFFKESYKNSDSDFIQKFLQSFGVNCQQI